MPVPPFPSVPSPSTYANNTALLTSALRGDVTNGVQFLASRPSFAGHNNNTPTISSANTFTSIVLQVDDSDPWLGHSIFAANNPQDWYCQAPGWYLCEGTVPWNSSGITGGDTFGCGIGVNTSGGVTNYAGQTRIVASASANPVVYAADLVQLTRTGAPGASGTDFVQLQAWNDTAGFKLLGSGNNFPRLQLRWMGTGAASSLAVPSNAAWPVPPSFVDQVWLNANIRDTIKFLVNPPMIRYTGPAAATLASGGWPTGTLIKLNTATLDNFSAYSSSTGLFTVPAGCGGIYYVYGQVSVTMTSTSVGGPFAAGVTVNGSVTWGNATLQQSPAASTAPAITGICARFRLNAGDTVGLEGFQNTGGTLNLGADTKLVIAWEAS